MKWLRDRVKSSETIYKRAPTSSDKGEINDRMQAKAEAFERWAWASRETWEGALRDVPSYDDAHVARVLAHVELENLLLRWFLIADNLARTGHFVPLDHGKTPLWSNLRISLKLAPVPPTVASFPDALKEVQDILKMTSFKSSRSF